MRLAGIVCRISIAFAAVLSSAGCRPADAPNDGVIRIGAIASLTGPAGEQGRNWVEGGELAIDELRARGIEAKLIVEDDETSPAKVAAAFQKLTQIDRVDAIIGGTWDYLAETAYPLAERSRTPFLTPSNPVEVLSPAAAKNPWVYTNGLSLRAARGAIRDFLVEKGVKTIGLVYPALPFGTVQADMVRSIAVELGVSVSVSFEFTYDDAYFDSVKLGALKISRAAPAIVFAVLDAGGVDLFLAELERLKAAPLFLTTQHLDQAFVLGGSPARYARSYGVYPRLEDGSFIERFRGKYTRDPKVYAPQGYDAVMFFASALKAGVDFGNPAAAFVYRGVTGEHRLPAPHRALVEDHAVIMTTAGGAFVEHRPSGEDEKPSTPASADRTGALEAP